MKVSRNESRLFLVLMLWAGTALAAGPVERVAPTTLRMPLAPPQYDYELTDAFPGLTFANPMLVTTPPGETNRLFVAERAGRIQVITNLAEPDKTLFLDISSRVSTSGEGGILGLAFHPGYETNRYFFVCYTTTGQYRVRVARFEISPENPNQGLSGSEVILIDQFHEANNHNAGDIHFGPDGYLYVAVGDEGGGNDTYNNAQLIDKDFFAGILRIDVDPREGSLAPNPHPAGSDNYAIPPDNPFVGVESFNGQPVDPEEVRTEFWAVGLRNPFRFSFDPETGRLYCADVGQGAREEVNIIEGGGNYGWAFREGTINGPKVNQAPAGFEGVEPIQDYRRIGATRDARFEGNSVTGGVVYHGDRVPGLKGYYIFADYVSGNIWGLYYDGMEVVDWRHLANEGGIVGFGIDPSNDDVLLADLNSNRIWRLGATTEDEPLPETLADTGAFSDLESLTPEPGIVPYDVNVPFWSDGATKDRWFAVPGLEPVIGFQAEGNWNFPVGTVWIKHFEIEMTNGVPESARRLETRFLARNSLGVHGLTYRWDSEANATLVPEEGMDEELVIYEPDGEVARQQTWHYPARSECAICHTASGGYALGFNTAQLNREHDYDGTPENQLVALSQAGYFDQAVESPHPLRRLAHGADGNFSLEYRVRSYLQANCAQCHLPGGSAPGQWDARITTPLSEAGLVNGALADLKEDEDNRVVVPGDPEHSMLLSRIEALDGTRMPPLGSSVRDEAAIALMTSWINGPLTEYESFEDWQITEFGSNTEPGTGPMEDYDEDGAWNRLEFLTGTDGTDPEDRWGITLEALEDRVEIRFPRKANRGFEVQYLTDFSEGIWLPLPVPGNAFLIAPEDGMGVVEDTGIDESEKYYRVRVFEP
ncbi:MAG TPA: PQQ-dependent sugar dehydrogenase [Methylomirabilota bacterium]|nr:PQQ-dependent sugar dehydrogenase [Methylomirabilota bacterium]